MTTENQTNPELLLQYLEDKGYWKQWLLEGEPSPQRAAAMLPLFLSVLELTTSKEEAAFWAHRASIFYVNVQWANHAVYGDRWGPQAKFLPWESFLTHLAQVPPEKGFLFFSGKFRTLPTAGHADTVADGRAFQHNSWRSAESALIFEPKENIERLEGKKLVFDPKIRSWAYSLMPVDIVTCYPIMQEGGNPDSFYVNRVAAIRRAYSGVMGGAVGNSPYKEIVSRQYEENGIKVLDTGIVYPAKHILSYDTSKLDEISANSEYIEKFILSFLRHTGQISV